MGLKQSFITVALILGVALPLVTQAQRSDSDYPAKPIRLIVPFSPGGATDAMARVVSNELSIRLKQSVVVDNRVGAGGNIGAEQAAKALPDGYTLFLGTIATNAINESLYSGLPFNPEQDFIGVAPLAGLPLVLVTSPTSGIGSVEGLIELSRKSPGKVTYASPGNGTALHLAGEIFQSLAKAKLTHVPYKGSAPALQDVLAGRVDIMFDTVISSLPHITAGKLRALGVTTKEDVSLLPGIQPLSRSALPGFEISAWNGIFAPRGTPEQIVTFLNKEIEAILSDKRVEERIASMGGIVMKADPGEFSTFVKKETAKYRTLIRDANISIK